MVRIGKYERRRGKCVNCGKRRLVTRCPCPVCQRLWDYMVICAECEQQELSCWYKQEPSAHLRNYDFKTRMMTETTTTNAEV